MSAVADNSLMQSQLTTGSTEQTGVCIERLDPPDSPNNNNNTSASSSPKNEGVASGLLKMLENEAILDGFDDLPPSDQLLDEQGRYNHGSLSGSGDGSFMHSHSEITDDDESPLQFHNERQFELEFKLHEAEQKVEQLNLQLKGKSMQLEQVQVDSVIKEVALISYEEEIMQLRQHMAQGSDASDGEVTPKAKPAVVATQQDGIGSVSLETAEQLSTKIISLQQRVEELEDIMVYTKLDNAQLKETVDFLKSKLKQYTGKKGSKTVEKTSSVRNLFGRK